MKRLHLLSAYFEIIIRTHSFQHYYIEADPLGGILHILLDYKSKINITIFFRIVFIFIYRNFSLLAYTSIFSPLGANTQLKEPVLG